MHAVSSASAAGLRSAAQCGVLRSGAQALCRGAALCKPVGRPQVRHSIKVGAHPEAAAPVEFLQLDLFVRLPEGPGGSDVASPVAASPPQPMPQLTDEFAAASVAASVRSTISGSDELLEFVRISLGGSPGDGTIASASQQLQTHVGFDDADGTASAHPVLQPALPPTPVFLLTSEGSGSD